VPIVTNIKSGVLPDVNEASRLGASCPRVSFLGTALPAGGGIGASAVSAHAVRRVWGKVAFVTPPQVNQVKGVTPPQVAGVTLPPAEGVTAQLGQPKNIYNYMTSASANAVGEGAAGPPTYREPA
jgi:hypothetical protein